MIENSLVTVGVSPCWDMTCLVDGIEWGEHKKVLSQMLVPAGKALNICKAIDWLGIHSTAAGLWGRVDYQQMLDVLVADFPCVSPSFTIVDGKTRTNLTVVDTQHKRDMHLRAGCELAMDDSLKRLGDDLDALASVDTMVFAGSMPESCVDRCASLVKQFCDKGFKVAVDTSGAAMAKIVGGGGLYLIKPNFEELCELLGRQIDNDADSIIRAGRSLCDAVEIVFVSRGADGALAITKDAAIECKVKRATHDVVNTVACGDYLLAGFLSQMGDDMKAALETAVKVATARAWGLTETMRWEEARRAIEVSLATN